MAAVRLSLPGKSPCDSAQTAEIKNYLRVLVSELKYLLTHIDADNMTSRAHTDSANGLDGRVETLEKSAARSRIQFGKIELSASGAGTGSRTITLERAYTGIDAYVALAQAETQEPDAIAVSTERISGTSFKIHYTVAAAGSYCIAWLAAGQ